ncbi:MAG: anti-sigma factor [Burkholderia sp.]|jgi:anti-sigma factor RsiW|uniref:anti-sigma factor n=1 Tax=Burkholderia sp. TaxID=36773 RepID=UPI00282C31E7|nr:anti-sigma factor [Burkholderia sp.]MDR0246320.1 anti-sigma factor [Burkholderia sp.]
MKMDDILLMAYVDGELPSHQRDAVDRAIAASADIASRVALFEASVLPYQRAFRHQAWPPVPPSLIRTVAEIAHVHAAPSDRAAPVRSRARAMAPWLAVAFVAGAFCCGAILHFAPGAVRGGFPPQGVPATAQATSPWIMAAVNYQRLYTRDTVALDASNPAVAAHTVENIRRDDGLRIRIPDLRAAGLAFKRIQRLNFNRKPLVQIVYLPEKGQPVALCAMKDDRPDTVLSRQQVGSMDVVTWRRGRITYALIGTPGDADLGAIGKRIADNGMDAVLGQLQHAGLAIAS